MPPSSALSIYLLAGEASGDALGAGLMNALKRQSRIPTQFHGIGGPLMEAQGLQSLFPMSEIALMGFAEIIPHVFRLKARIRQAASHILQVKPDMVVTIDAPGFNFRVVQSLATHHSSLATSFIHYVAPSVWAYKPERAKKMAELFGHVLCLLPFEPPYFEEEGMKATFVGHPAADAILPGEMAALPDIDTSAHVIAMLPGSRKGELKRMLPVFEETLALLEKKFPALHVLMPLPPAMVPLAQKATAHWKRPPWILSTPAEKQAALQRAEVALAKSGTISLELAAAGLPMVTAHKVHTLSAWLVKKWIRIPYVNLINILKNEPIVPEYLQEHCAPSLLADSVSSLLGDMEEQETQRQAFREILRMLRAPGAKPAAEAAASAILSTGFRQARAS